MKPESNTLTEEDNMSCMWGNQEMGNSWQAEGNGGMNLNEERSLKTEIKTLIQISNYRKVS